MRHEMFREMLAENNYESGWHRVMGLRAQSDLDGDNQHWVCVCNTYS